MDRSNSIPSRSNSEAKHNQLLRREGIHSKSLCDEESKEIKSKARAFSTEPKSTDYLPKIPRRRDVGKKTLVLDLDETLVHSTFVFPKRNEVPPNLAVNVQWDDGIVDKTFVRVRPYVNQFLMEMTKLYEVVIFTASIQNYAYPLVYRLDRIGYGYKVLTRKH